MQIIVTPKAIRQFDRIPRIDQKKIKRKLETLEQNPYEGKKLSAELSETRTIRAWPYRILFTIERNEIRITNVVRRQGAYK